MTSKHTNTDKRIFKNNYKAIPIKSDSRVHDLVLDILRESIPFKNNHISLLDIASGKGALAQRVIDFFPNIIVDCNDLEQGIMTKGARKIYSKDLNLNFNFNLKYDVILAVEVIEHLENPFHFIRFLKKHLKPNGFILITTPNVDSFFDRLWFLFFGYPFYFGSRGIVNSGGHITMCPKWLLSHIASSLNLKVNIVSHSIDSKGLLGFKGRALLSLFKPLKLILRDVNDESNTICIFKNIN